MFATASNNLIGVIPNVDSNLTTGQFFVYNTDDSSFKSFEVCKNVPSAADVAQHKHTAPVESLELKEDNEIEGGEKKAENKAPNCVVRALTFAKNNEYIIAVTEGHLLCVYSTVDSKLVAYIPTSRKATVVTMTPDERFIIFGDRLGDVYAVKFENLITGKPVEANLLYSHGCVITTLNFIKMNNKDYFISGDQEHKIRISEYPDFFVIQSCLMGHKSTITGTVSLNDNIILSTSSVSPVISYVVGDVVKKELFKSHTTQLSLWNGITGERISNLYHEASKDICLDESKALTQYSSVTKIGSSTYLLPCAVSCAKKDNKSYAYGTTLVAYGSLDKIQVASVVDNNISINDVVVTGTLDGQVQFISTLGDDKLIALTTDNKLSIIEVDGVNLNVKSTVDIPAPTVTKAVSSVISDVTCRNIEAYIKHEVLFDKQQEKADAKRRKRNNGEVVSDSEDDEAFE